MDTSAGSDSLSPQAGCCQNPVEGRAPNVGDCQTWGNICGLNTDPNTEVLTGSIPTSPTMHFHLVQLTENLPTREKVVRWY